MANLHLVAEQAVTSATHQKSLNCWHYEFTRAAAGASAEAQTAGSSSLEDGCLNEGEMVIMSVQGEHLTEDMHLLV